MSFEKLNLKENRLQILVEAFVKFNKYDTE